MATDVASTPRTTMTKLGHVAEPDVLKLRVERARIAPESRGGWICAGRPVSIDTIGAGGDATLLSLDESGI